MNYFISKHDCSFIDSENARIPAGSLFNLTEIGNRFSTIIDDECGKVVAINFYDLIYKKRSSKYCKLIKFGQNNIFVFDFFDDRYSVCLEVFDEILNIEVSNQISIIYGDDSLTIKKYDSIKFSHIAHFDKIVAVFFEGKRNFVVLLEKNKILFCNYYDEISIEGNNLTILSKLQDSLNHGKVAKIEKNKFESFLVYLDDYDLNLKTEFLASVFLDCVMAGNEKYLSHLLDVNLQGQIENLKNFCDEILDFYPISETQCLIEKKDAKFDIFEFSICESKISNITIVDC